MTTLFAIGMPGPLEMMIVAAIILLLFGHRLPSVMRSLGKGLTEFKKGVNDISDDIDDDPRDRAEKKRRVADDDDEDEPRAKSKTASRADD